MKDKYINHITLATGNNRCSPLSEVPDWALEQLTPWLMDAVRSSELVPLPGDGLSRYQFKAVKYLGLVATVFAPEDRGGIPLVTLGVAQRSREAEDLWAYLVAQFGAREGLQMPSTPWCAVHAHPGLLAFPDVMQWAGDFERCIAWAWIMRKKSEEPDTAGGVFIRNNGAKIVSTNYFDTPNAQAGYAYLSFNAGAARLLVPLVREVEWINEMATAKYVIISRGAWKEQGGREAYHLLFEDETQEPFSVTVLTEQTDRLIPEIDQGSGIVLTVWTQGPEERLSHPVKYRHVDYVPCYDRWVDH